MEPSVNDASIDSLVEDKNRFNDYLYTPLGEALDELKRRQSDIALKEKVASFLGKDLPQQMEIPRVVLARQITTPNYELIRFLNIPDSTGIMPLFFEYQQDKMIYKNPFKYHLGKLLLHIGTGKNGGVKNESIRIMDFDQAHGKPLNTIKTIWGESLVDFHHALLLNKYPQLDETIFDGSSWYADNGTNPAEYYKKFFSLFIRNGILFENFLVDKNELEFTKQVVLPSFIEVCAKFGLKPLIVALEPTDIEGDEFWLSYPYFYKELVEARQNNAATELETDLHGKLVKI